MVELSFRVLQAEEPVVSPLLAVECDVSAAPTLVLSLGLAGPVDQDEPPNVNLVSCSLSERSEGVFTGRRRELAEGNRICAFPVTLISVSAANQQQQNTDNATSMCLMFASDRHTGVTKKKKNGANSH